MRDSGLIVHKPQWSILHALMPSFPQSYYWINAKQCMDLFIRNRPFLPIFWKRRKKAEHLLSKCSFPVYCALLPTLYNLSCARILIAARGLITIGPPYVLLCLPAWQQIRRALLFQTFFLQSLASKQGLDHLNWTQKHWWSTLQKLISSLKSRFGMVYGLWIHNANRQRCRRIGLGGELLMAMCFGSFPRVDSILKQMDDILN